MLRIDLRVVGNFRIGRVFLFFLLLFNLIFLCLLSFIFYPFVKCTLNNKIDVVFVCWQSERIIKHHSDIDQNKRRPNNIHTHFKPTSQRTTDLVTPALNMKGECRMSHGQSSNIVTMRFIMRKRR
ncbi:hypothetical protein EON65_38515 [archaeon]|nr:MAG: hypothetical protein EON65_38515 [archaeon]